MRAVRTVMVVVALAGALVACRGGDDGRVDVRFAVGDDIAQVIRAEVAIDREEQARGLMGRETLGDREGMLFIFPTASVRRFWMKGTLIPLDLIGINEGVVVSVVSMVPCEADPCTRYPTGFAEAALEVAAGVAAELGIRVGTPVASDALS